jgi:hypothetical protein
MSSVALMHITDTRMTGASGAALICQLDNTNSMRIGHDLIKLSTPFYFIIYIAKGIYHD